MNYYELKKILNQILINNDGGDAKFTKYFIINNKTIAKALFSNQLPVSLFQSCQVLIK